MALGYRLFSLFIAVLCCTFVSSETVFISNSTAFEHYMCNESYVNVELVLELNSSVTYFIQNGDFCIVQTKKIAIRSISSNSAVLRCSDNSTLSTPTQGFTFIGATITLQRVTFINCGIYLKTLPVNIINMFNSSSLYYSSTHAAALLFIQCTVVMSEVVLTGSYGFAVIGVNLVDSVLQNVHVSNSSASATIYDRYNETIGCGMILHFLSYPQTDELKIHTVSVENSFFLFNSNPQNRSCANKMDPQSVSEMILSAVALTILYTQHNYQANVYVNNSRFQYNLGTTSGAVLILHYNSHHGGIFNINNTYFKGNHILGDQQCYGADLSFVFLSSSGMPIFNYTYYLIVENTILKDAFFNPNDKNYFKTGVYIGVKEDDSVNVIILFKSLRCITTTASIHTGVCMFAEIMGFNKHGRVLVILESVVASNKSLISFSSIASYTGMFTFHGVNCYINGTKEKPSTFSNNVGVVIDATDTNIYLSGDVLFDGNKATSGAAIKMKYGSRLHFMNGLTANFTNNQAELFGGAIYADVFNKKTDCAFYFQNKDIKLHFNNNIAAEAGNDIWASPIFYCQFNNSSNSYTPNQAMEFYKNHFHFLDHSENNFRSFSTKPTKLLLNNTMTSNGDIYVYPGQRKSLNVSALDELNRFVYTIVRVEIIPKKRDSISDLWLSYEDKVQTIQESRYKTFTSIDFTVHTTTVYNQSFKGILILSLLNYPEAVYLEVHIHPCPPGFILDNITTGDCVCSPVLYTFAYENSFPVTCSIQTQTISKSHITNSWVGLIEMVNGIKTFGVSICPIGNCESYVLFDYFYSAEMKIAVAYEANDLLYTAPLCVNHREGTLCGRCNDGLSTVFGSRDCDSCSNKWLWTIMIYFGLGALLICFLYAMRLTLTAGTLNGIIFFAQVTNGSLIDLSTFSDSGDTVGFKLAIGFLLFLNLNLPFPLCFYDGMTELWKTGLSLVFPIYLLTIVVVLIILSRYSTWLSNRISHSSVQVLVTVVHLSFSKIILAIIDVFTPARIYTENGYIDVWYWDGTVRYLSPEHRNLMICASLIFLTFIAPYITLLLLAKPLRRCSLANKYLRPVLEAIHGPYKEDKKYWFVFRLVLVIILYIIYAVYKGNNVFKMYLATGAILVFVLTAQAYFKPFKNNFLNLMDTWIMFNITFIYTTICSFIITHQIDVAIAIGIVGVLLVLINFLLILVYHFLWVTGLLPMVERKCNTLNQKILHHLSVFRSDNSNIRLHQPDDEDSFYDSCRQYREPFLSDSD